jgi:hypothetical protein
MSHARSITHLRWKRLAVLLLALSPLAVAMAGPSAARAKLESHCVVTIEGQKESGELIVSPELCTSSRDAALSLVASTSSPIATHYTGFNYTGSTYSVAGTGCTGGWLNLPSSWVNVISSTSSICDVDHFDSFFLSGTSQRAWSPGSNLTYMDNKTNSIQYW